MAVQIQIRRGTAAAWTSANPTLAAGEFAIETDTDFYKIGDGSTAWTSLGYSSLPSGSALLASPTFTGVPAAPTAAANTSTTQIATTAFVMTEVGDYAPLASPTFTGTVTVPDLTVNGTTTTINSTTLTVDDKNLELGSVATPSDTTADGGGITLKGASDKTITWTNSTDTWDFNQGITVTGTATATAFAGPLTGNASTATALATGRTIAGVSFDGTANIDLGTDANMVLASQSFS
jgi:hypothetical protein